MKILVLLLLLLACPAALSAQTPTPTLVPCVDEDKWDPPVANGTVVGETLTVNGAASRCARCCDCTEDPTRHHPLQCWDHDASAWVGVACCTNRLNP